MLRFSEFDLKTGQVLQERDPHTNTRHPKQKDVEHSYLEHWLAMHSISDPQLFVAKFYAGVTEADRLRLEAAGKVLVYSNGKDGYFVDPPTARLLTEGNAASGVSSVYAAGRASPHTLVAYGSLISSDGVASTSVHNARLLVIDDEARSHGSTTLTDRFGKPIPPAELSKLYDKMGDGTMLITPQMMSQLITESEREQITKTVFAKADISSAITAIAQDAAKLDTALQEVERQINALVQRTVTQFRAATVDLPGMVKGTMATSDWCRRLGVDAILSKNDIKGDDGRLSQPGIKEVSDFWLNRKSDGKYGEQAVGAQVKGCIPEATLHEFNPRTQQQAEAVAAIASDPRLLLQHYVADKENHRELIQDETEPPVVERPDWLYAVAKVDHYGMLSEFSKVNYELENYLKGQRIDNAIQGIYVPSAMAQHHSQLQVWEVCNKDLPHGAVVAYYRSPFPNVGAAAIAINNTEIIKQQDPEAYRKEGVAYLPPWTAKHIAITDFDRDSNGYFCGYVATVPNLPQQIRTQLQPLQAATPAQQYEAGRALLSQLIEQIGAGVEVGLQPAQYPVAVKEFIERTAPECKPPEIVKQPKVKHPWHESESHSAALWRAWSTTADNPTGKVANVGMTLQSLALETHYISQERKEPLLRHIAAHYQKLLAQQEYGKFTIPSDEQLVANGFPAYDFQTRIADIAQVNRQLMQLKDPTQRQAFVEQQLETVRTLLNDLVNGPTAMNLQTAVDTAKSARGIDEDLHQFAKLIAHKEHWLRQHQKDASLYTHGKSIPTNTQEPIGWNVEQSNQLYHDTQLSELPNAAFRDLFPNRYTPEQERRALTIAESYKHEIERGFAVEARLRENRPADEQPTMLVTTPRGNQITIERLCDGGWNEDPTIWQAIGRQDTWQILLERQQPDWKNPETVKALLQITRPDGSAQTQLLGFVAPESVEHTDLHQRIAAAGGRLPIVTPVVEIHAPYQVENDKDDIIARAVATRQAAVAAIPPNERFAYACALNRHSAGVDLILKDFLPELTQQLQSVPEINLWGIQHNTNEAGLIPDGEYIVRFSQFTYTKAGEERSARSVAVVVDGVEKQFASINERSMHLPIGTLVQADIRIEGKVAYMQVKELLEPPPLHRVSQAERSTPTGAITTSAAPLEPLLIVTDGACKGNPGSGGWGAILMQGNSYHEIGGGGLETTNNRMEMTAGIEALKDAKAKGMVERDTPITIISDSQLFINGATGAWQRKANLDLWAEYDRAASGLNLQFQWVKGHNGHELNERVDAIAQAFARGQQPALEQDAPPSPPIASAPAPSEAMPSDVSIPSFPPPLPSESTEPHLDFSTVADAPSSHASPAYDPESLVGYQPLTGADSSTVQSHASTYHPSRGELLEWLAVARVIGSSEQQETIKALGLTLRDHYNQEQGMSEAAPPTQYRHSAVAVNEQAYLQMRDAVVQLRESFSQMSLQPHQTPAAMLHVPQDRVQHLQIQHEIG